MDAAVAKGRGEGELTPKATERERAIVDYALELTIAPGKMTESALAPMRAAGLSDAEILDTNQVAAYYAYANRLVDGLGVRLEAPDD